VVLPTSDRLVDVLHRGRDRFPARVVLAIPAADVVVPLLDKASAAEAAKAAGLDVLPWVAVRDAGDIAATGSLPLPLAVRPTRWDTAGSDPVKVAVLRDRAAVRPMLEHQLSCGAELVVQPYVEVPDDAVEFVLAWRSADGTATALCEGRKRRQAAPDGGVMVWGETADRPDARRAATAFLDASGYTGIGGIELIRDGDRLWFVECNPRLEAIHFLAARAGQDHVAMEYRQRAGVEPGDRTPPPNVAAAAWVGAAALAALRAPGGSPWRTARDWLAFRRSPRRARAVWSWRDPGPGLAVAARLLAAAGRRRSSP
jgi:predicted ATP-grasp superfamily ATP-dependent carboligase